MHIALGVTGCIAAYKAALIIRELQKRGVSGITVIMTDSAMKFITPLTLETLTASPVITGLWEPRESSEITHISLARKADVLLVAPATANIIGKFANGVADDFLSTFYLAFEKQVIVAPAMNSEMWAHRRVQENVDKLKKDGVKIIPPGIGYLACGEKGEGRLADVEDIVNAVFEALTPEKPLIGKKIIVTAGPTREYIDPVRFISNPSSGKMGFAIAEEALRLGADVTLISGPVQIMPPAGVKIINVMTAGEMSTAVKEKIVGVDVLIMSAAVSDFKPKFTSSSKVKKEKVPSSLELEPAEDILLSIKDEKLLKVGFAAETGDAELKAEMKLKNKNLDFIVANDIAEQGSGFAADTNKITIINKSGSKTSLGLMTKKEAAAEIMKAVTKALLGG